MKIKVTKSFPDLAIEKKPKKGKIYSVLYTKHGLFNPTVNKCYVIDVNGNEITVHPDECKIVEEEKSIP